MGNYIDIGQLRTSEAAGSRTNKVVQYTTRTKVVPLGPSHKKQPFPPRILQVVAGSFAVELSHSKAFKVF